jgi:DnaJ-class molecular chaperone
MYSILVKSTREQSNSFGFAIYSSRIGLWTVLEKNLTKEDADKKLVELRSNPELHCCSGVEWKAVETSSLDLCPECNGTGYHSGCKKCNRTGLHNNHHR